MIQMGRGQATSSDPTPALFVQFDYVNGKNVDNSVVKTTTT